MKLFEVQTLKASVFRNLSEAMKDLFLELTLEINENGILGYAIDSTHTVVANLDLSKDGFDNFECSEKVIIGIEMQQFHKIIKTMSNYDILTLSMNDDENNFLKIRIENPDTNTINNFKLNLVEIQNKSEIIPNNTVFDVVSTMPSNLFQKIIKEMNSISKYVDIKSFNDELIFSCSGVFSERETIIKESVSGMKILRKNPDTDIVQNEYNLKILNSFTKCTHLTPNIDLHLKNDYPLIAKYDVGTLGTLRLALSYHSEEDNDE